MIPKLDQFKKKVYSYCCLNHFIEGKNTKGATFCYNHRQLGIINPITTLNPTEKQRLLKTKTQNIRTVNIGAQNLIVNAQQYDMKHHTHYLNQIQDKHSLPKRLVYPREYIQKINKKYAFNKEQRLPIYQSQHKSFQQTFQLFRKFAKLSNFVTQKQLKDDIMRFATQNHIKMQPDTSNQFNLGKTQAPHILFSKINFITYLLKIGMCKEDANLFWAASYNKDRFSLTQKLASNILMVQTQYVSMRAFIYNFKKYYLEECAQYRNTFSQSALRQRLVDLRLFLQPWYQRNIYLKENMIQWRNQELDICSFFKKSGFQDEFSQMVDLIGQRNKQWFVLRTLAKCFYGLTDQKHIGLNQINNRVAQLIQEKTQSLICFMEFTSKFKQHLIQIDLSQQLNESTPIKQSQSFPVTLMVQFLDKTKKEYAEHEQAWIVRWIRQIYKYLYFFKTQDFSSIIFDKQSLKLVCVDIVKIDTKLLEQFVAFKNKEIDQFMELISSISDQINQKVQELMPQLQGKKKYLVQCNYVTQTLLRIVKRQNLYVFYQLHQIVNLVQSYESSSEYHQCISQLQNLIKSDMYKDKVVPDKFWKHYFMFNRDKQQQNKQISGNRSGCLVQTGPKYKDAYQNYQQVKKAFNLSQLPASVQNGKKYKQNESKKKNNPKANSKTQKYVKKIQAQRKQSHQQIQEFQWSQFKQKKCSHSNGYCSFCNQIISTQVSSVVSQVENLQNYLMNLLSI